MAMGLSSATEKYFFGFHRDYMNIFRRGNMHFAEDISNYCRCNMHFAETKCNFAEAIYIFCEILDQISPVEAGAGSELGNTHQKSLSKTFI